MFNPQNYYWNPYAVPVFLTGISFIILGLFIAMKSRKLINLVFLLWSIACSFWLIGGALTFAAKEDWLVIEIYNKFEFLGVCFISMLGYLVSLLWDKRLLKKQKKFVITGFIISAIFYLSNLKYNYILSGVYHYFWGRYFKNGLGGTIFIIYWVIPFMFMMLNYILLYKKAAGVKKQQFKLMIIATSIAYLGATDWLPCYGLELYPLGYVAILIFFLLTAYNIIHYRAFEIDTVIHRTIMWALTVLLLIAPLGFILVGTMPWLGGLGKVTQLMIFLLVFLVFLSYYHKLKPKIDHLFRRRKYDYYEVLNGLGQKIGSELELEKVQSRIFKELKEILYIRNGALLVQQPGQEDYEKVADPSKQASTASEALLFHSKLSQYLNREQKAIEREQVEVDPQYQEIKEEALAWLKEKELEVLIPIVLEGKVNGLIGIGKKENLQAYTQKDIELLEKMGRQIGVTIDNALHHEDIVEKGRLEEEMKLGQEIQMNLLPKEVPQVEGLKVAGLMIPAKEIGGDYYDYIVVRNAQERSALGEEKDKSIVSAQRTTQDARLSIVIGDVSGKGVGAGLIMATAKATLKGLSEQGLSPRQILSKANSLLHEYTKGEKFMTMLYLSWDAQAKKLNYSSAGHEHIIIYRSKMADGSFQQAVESQAGTLPAGVGEPVRSVVGSEAEGGARRSLGAGRVEVIKSGGFMLGMLENIEGMLEDRQIDLNPGDKVILYTDGVTEARNLQEELYTLDRLVESVFRHGGKLIGELIEGIRQDVYGFISTQAQYDDITLVGMEIA